MGLHPMLALGLGVPGHATLIGAPMSSGARRR